MSKRTSAVLEPPVLTQAAILDRTATQALATAFELEARAQRLANTLQEIAARDGIPVDVKVLIARTLEA